MAQVRNQVEQVLRQIDRMTEEQRCELIETIVARAATIGSRVGHDQAHSVEASSALRDAGQAGRGRGDWPDSFGVSMRGRRAPSAVVDTNMQGAGQADVRMRSEPGEGAS